VLDALRPGDLAVIADLSDVEPGVRVIQLQFDRTRLPASVQERGIEPRSIRVTLERVVEREVQIKPRFEGEPPAGYAVHWEVSPTHVRIKGQASQVRDINEVSTETFSLVGKIGYFTESVAVDIGAPNVNVSEGQPDRVQLKVIIDEIQKERTIERVPVSLIGARPGVRVVPRFVTVRISGPRSVVESITANDIEVKAGYAGAAEIALTGSLRRDAERVIVVGIEPGSVRVR
jgi:YbbR domain-containing protein